MRGLGILLAWLVALAISAGGCGFGSGSPAASPDQLLKGAFGNLEKATSYRVQGTFTSTVPRVDIDVTAVAPTESKGSITDDTHAAKLSFISMQGKTYFSGTSIPGLPTKLSDFLSGKWVFNSTSPADAEPLVSTKKLTMPASLEDAFLRGQAGMRSKAVTFAGQKGLALSNATETVTVSTGSDPVLLGIERSVDAVPLDGFTQVNLGFGEFSKMKAIELPSSPLDLADQTVLPANYSEVKGSLAFVGTCAAGGCGAKISVTNSAGQIEPSPPASVKISFKQRSNGVLIDSCTAPIPLIAHGATVDVGCRVAGGAWQKWIVNGGLDYVASFEVSNPLYD
jgi:hypothetical protein